MSLFKMRHLSCWRSNNTARWGTTQLFRTVTFVRKNSTSLMWKQTNSGHVLEDWLMQGEKNPNCDTSLSTWGNYLEFPQDCNLKIVCVFSITRLSKSRSKTTSNTKAITRTLSAALWPHILKGHTSSIRHSEKRMYPRGIQKSLYREKASAPEEQDN